MKVTENSARDCVLLVDDTRLYLQVLHDALEPEGYQLLTAQSGEEALDIARERRPQLILLDINMGGIDGYETCRQLKADPQTSDAAIIFLSARGDIEDRVYGLELGAVDYVCKPFDREEVVVRVRKHLESYHEHQDLKQANIRLRERLEGGFQEHSTAELSQLIAQGESDRVEFKSTLRQNLHASKPDKRIENACLKTLAAYLNSNGGVLFVGVNDDGQATGLGPDQFASEDKLLLHFNGLLKSLLGVESTPFIRSEIRGVDGARVLVVQCLPSTEPVFFRRDNDELFFVRAGNGTQPLKPSEVLAYLSRRENVKQPHGQDISDATLQEIGSYTLDEKLGEGGMGVVYRAHHKMLARPAAIKLLPVDKVDKETLARFEREVQLTSQLQHPNTIRIYDYGRSSKGCFYYAMEYLDGISLQQLVETHGAQPEGRVVAMLKQLAGSLAEAHATGIMHRDIKPDNIMLMYRDSLGEFVKLLDFGLVKSTNLPAEAGITASGAMTGTPMYISPEGIEHPDKVGPRSDLYSLGTVAYFLLTGQPIFDGESPWKILMQHLTATPSFPSRVRDQPLSDELERLIMRCLEKDPNQRPQSAQEMLDVLSSCPTSESWSPEDGASWWAGLGAGN